MSIQNEMSGCDEMNRYLNQQGAGLIPIEVYSLISGMIYNGNDDSSRLPLLHDLTNEGMAFGHGLTQALRKMHSATSDALQDDGLLFQSHLPNGDDISAFDQADALVDWVNHSLLGPGVIQPKPNKMTDGTGEVIDGLHSITQLGYGEDGDQEELKMLPEEIIEYVRIATLLCHDTLTHSQSTAPEVQKPTLHQKQKT